MNSFILMCKIWALILSTNFELPLVQSISMTNPANSSRCALSHKYWQETFAELYIIKDKDQPIPELNFDEFSDFNPQGNVQSFVISWVLPDDLASLIFNQDNYVKNLRELSQP